ncbi:MAG: cytochrome P450 [Pseudomonadota bacterium]
MTLSPMGAGRSVNDVLERLLSDLPSADTVANPYPSYAQLREHTPLFGYQDYPPGTVPGQDEPVNAWVLMKYSDVEAAARDHAAFSSLDPLQEQSSAPSLMLVNHDNPEHDRLRGYVSHPFAFRQVEAIRPWLIEQVNQMLAELPDGEVEVVSQLTSLIPARVMMKLLGRPDEDATRCRDWANAFMLSADLSAQDRAASNEAMAAYFVDCVGACAAAVDAGENPPDGLIGHILCSEVDGERLGLEEVIRFCMTLIVAGAETTTYLLTNLLHNLATMPDQVVRLQREPAMVLPFINETLRHSGPPQRLFRIATRDVAVGGKQIHRGDWVALFFGAANHDPAVFPHPERFDMDRSNLRQQLSMGTGIHQCLGFAVAKMEAAVLVEAVVERFSKLRLGVTAPVPQTASLLTHSSESLHLVFQPT